MKSTKLQTLKGFRDFLPEQAIKRKYMIDKIISVFELYGFDPLETPALEYSELLLGKYGNEADKLLYLFEDRGGRRVGLRYDQTVPTARVIAQYPDLPKPFKRYQIQNVWRAENTQKGRYREFLQCDADIIGSSSPLADAEILALVYDIYKKLGLEIVIKVNDRALLKEISINALPTLDKLKKIGEEGVIKELQEKGFSQEAAINLLKQARAFEASIYLRQVMDIYEQMGYPKNSWEFESTLVRGLDYYTGLIFEVVLKSDQMSSSLCGGGRYDNLIGMFSKENIPAVGFAIGFDRTLEALNAEESTPEKSSSDVLVTVFNANLAQISIKTVTYLRENDINSEIYLDEASLDKQLKYADKKNIPYAVIIGENEAQSDVVVLKNMRDKTQETLKLEDIPSKIQ